MLVRRPVAVAAALILSASALAGCGDEDPRPTFEPTPSGTASASVSPSESPVAMEEPTPPAAMRGKGVKAAKAAIRHYHALINYAQGSGDTNMLADLGSASCDPCSNSVGALKRLYAHGGHIEGGDQTVETVQVLGISRVNAEVMHVHALADISSTDQVVFSPDGSEQDFKAASSTIRYDVVRDSTGWRIADWEVR